MVPHWDFSYDTLSLSNIRHLRGCFALITLARAMLKRGHACSIIANPVFKNIVQTGGIDFIELGTTLQYQELTQDPALFQPTRAFSVIAKKGILPLLSLIYQIFTGFSPVDSIIVSPLLLFASHICPQEIGLPFRHPSIAAKLVTFKIFSTRFRHSTFSQRDATRVGKRILCPARQLAD